MSMSHETTGLHDLRSHKFPGDLHKITRVLRASRLIKNIFTMLESSWIHREISTKGSQDFG